MAKKSFAQKSIPKKLPKKLAQKSLPKKVGQKKVNKNVTKKVANFIRPTSLGQLHLTNFIWPSSSG